ncbi:NAD(P)-dependent oxidoreductase [Yinghuangia seranimata]|uniref:NAD(P)-dependent oxidoreductase n=1 Tax=Yinghuangia seranimata TaxID=408067 RepID=UPI00248BFA31|nr:NAD(P)H-binding protein [Yinghuangia seranimata]MDI2131093.1 NAD(P)H-binding protein [Yinghuangia seranimata]
MRITVFGAAGSVGSRVVAEAVARGHEVTAVVRDPARFAELPDGALPAVGDATDPARVAELAAGQDLVVAATRPPVGAEEGLVAATRGLLAGLAGTGVRLLVVGGAGSLNVPGTDGTVIDQPDFPPSWRPIAEACNAQLAAVRAADDLAWTYLSPAAMLEPGTRTGRFRLGTDELVVAADGTSAISMEDLAVALIDEAEEPRHIRRRFTLAY